MNISLLPKITCPACKKEFRPLSLIKNTLLTNRVEKNSKSGNIEDNKRLVDENKICAICGNPLSIKWTVVHGNGYCECCGCPYILEHAPKREPELKCGIKEDLRGGYRHVYMKNQDLEKYNLGPKPNMSVNKGNMTHRALKIVSAENMEASNKNLSGNDILKALTVLEERDLDSSDELIEVLDGKGVLVHQKTRPIPTGEPIYYSFAKLRSILEILNKGTLK